MSGDLVLQGVWHFSFTVSDLDRSIVFYRDVLGLHLVQVQDQDNEYTRRLVGYPNAILRVAQFAVPGQPRGISTHDLELVEYLQPRICGLAAEIARPGAAHLAITVDDIHAAFTRLEAAGVRFVSEPNQITEGVNRGGLSVYLRDHDGIVIELLQPPPRGRNGLFERRGNRNI